jgi:hypothetical protein
MYVLIGSQHSLYTGKLRAYLRYKGIPFEEIAASQELYKSVILPRTGVAFIPVLVGPLRSADNPSSSNSSSSSSSSTGAGQDTTPAAAANSVKQAAADVLQDSHAIILQLEQVYPAHPVAPTTPQQCMAAMLLQLYGDEHLLLPAMHYRWSYPHHATYMHHQFGEWLLLITTAGLYKMHPPCKCIAECMHLPADGSTYSCSPEKRHFCCATPALHSSDSHTNPSVLFIDTAMLPSFAASMLHSRMQARPAVQTCRVSSS